MTSKVLPKILDPSCSYSLLSLLSPYCPFLTPRRVLFWDGDFSDPKSDSESYKPFLTNFFSKPANPSINMHLTVMFPSNDRNSTEPLENHFKSEFYCTVLINLQRVESYWWKIFLMSLFFKGSKGVWQRNTQMPFLNIYASKWTTRFSIEIISPWTQSSTLTFKENGDRSLCQYVVTDSQFLVWFMLIARCQVFSAYKQRNKR